MLNYYFHDTISNFLVQSSQSILGAITLRNPFDSTLLQNKSWEQQIYILRNALKGMEGDLFFEFSIPRMGKRVDVIMISDNVVFVIEFKVGELEYFSYQYEQVWDYALDLKHFHKPSHSAVIVPILVCTNAKYVDHTIKMTSHQDNLLLPLKTNQHGLSSAIRDVLQNVGERPSITAVEFSEGVYSPTPTIVEAAISLYNNHSVEDITRSGADAINLSKTADEVSNLIHYAKMEKKKLICLVTGVPGAGKTLVGLKVATSQLDHQIGNKSVYLSGNAPLVAVLQEALATDKITRGKASGKKISKSEAIRSVRTFIQIIHNYRDAAF